MPGILHAPLPRRSFLRFSALGVALVATGCRSATPDADAALHLALLSDTHIPGDPPNGHRGFDPTANLRRILPDVVAARPAGILINGDAARLDGKPADYAALKELLQPAATVAPVFIGLGNHDNRPEFLKVFPSPAGAAQNVAGKHVLLIDHPAVRVVQLDSLLYVNQTAGLLGRTQRQWLTEFLPRHNDRPVVLVVHHTLEDGDGDLLDAQRLFDIVRPHRHVQAIFYGHSHVWEIRRRDRLHLINLPAVGYNFRDQDPVGWVDAHFDRTGVRLTLRAIAGNRADDGRPVRIDWA